GGALVDSVDMLHFTGSTEVGRGLMERGAKRLLPLTLELGGKDPMIVLEDANLERAANAAVFGAMQNAGQTCISLERVYVEGEAVRLANDSEFGLDSSVFAGSHRRAEKVARRLQSGAAVVNDALVNYFAMEIPIGGMKQSGVGARHGRKGIQKYCQCQNLV